MNPMRLIKTAAAGYRDSNPAERGLFGMAASFAVTVASARTINYARERRRALPMWRSLGRRLYHLPGGGAAQRVHHFIPGIGLGFATGGAAILTRDDGLDGWLSLPFGIGVGLTTDELGLLLEGSNPYWGSETFALAQSATASLAAAALAAVFVRRGLRTSTRSEPPGERAADDHLATAAPRVVRQH
jgi:hypothetical protein